MIKKIFSMFLGVFLFVSLTASSSSEYWFCIRTAVTKTGKSFFVSDVKHNHYGYSKNRVKIFNKCLKKMTRDVDLHNLSDVVCLNYSTKESAKRQREKMLKDAKTYGLTITNLTLELLKEDPNDGTLE